MASAVGGKNNFPPLRIQALEPQFQADRPHEMTYPLKVTRQLPMKLPGELCGIYDPVTRK